ncbi:unnamed protein product [Didymodactylos carnosus]|uniref:Enkurin domain-containing protein n=1 Tax=Didymodactylos carnosus TaxID=1234261 RepID=A0A814HPT8_9BILA|nr:unnamed protein product [Didymodactylos carnosus]CAF3785207.1 unnamed protein product [Didymodactylos carnosus]
MVVGQNGAANQEESVYNLVPRTEIRAPKAQRYESTFKKAATESLNKGKYPHRTMGYAEEPLPQSENFLKKHEKEKRLPEVKETTTKIDRNEIRKPAVPTKNDIPKMGVKTEKNFIQSNALDAVMAVPRKPERNLVDDRFGDNFPVDPSGLVPKYLKKKDFGEVPVYIKKRQEDMKKAQDEYSSYVTDYFRRGAMREMGDSERRSVIDGLKKQWEDVHHEYQTLSVLIDTIPKRQRKERLEHEMQLLEKDIDLLEKHQVIYIAD